MNKDGGTWWCFPTIPTGDDEVAQAKEHGNVLKPKPRKSIKMFVLSSLWLVLMSLTL